MGNNVYNFEKEKREAINAGNRALESLQAAYNKLDSASTWGIFDIIGGGFFTTLIKHSKIEKAQELINDAKDDLLTFSDELDDLGLNLERDLQVNIDSFLKFADWFFDGFVADVYVQTKISDAKSNVKATIKKVKNILKKLNELE